MTHYGEVANPSRTPQTEQAKSGQVLNNTGGFVFAVGPWTQLDRFLILGQVGATYYASERAVVKDNEIVIHRCLTIDGPRAVKRIADISESGRAPKNDPAIFALALAASSKDVATRRAALEALPKVCRIPTHLFHWMQDVKAMRGFGRSLRTAIARWYTERPEAELAMHALKYQQRDGWSHRDVLRLVHPVPKTKSMDATFRWMVGGVDALSAEAKPEKRSQPIDRSHLHQLLEAFEELHGAKTVREVVSVLRTHDLPREAVPTEWLNHPEVWEALLPHMGITAMIRNLGKMTAVGVLKPMSEASKMVTAAITHVGVLAKGRVHPMQLLLAKGIYGQGHGDKGKLRWQPVREVNDALDAGFYLAFKTVEPTGKNTMLGLDVSGSMDGGTIAGAPGITPRVAAAAMAMVTARAEKNWLMFAFCDRFVPFDIAKNERLDSVVAKMGMLGFGSTNCALPMLHATEHNLDVDMFCVFTDNETNTGSTHPFQALNAYRRKSGRPAKLATIGFTATNSSIADPGDAGMLDVVGFDAHAPALLASFARGEV